MIDVLLVICSSDIDSWSETLVSHQDMRPADRHGSHTRPRTRASMSLSVIMSKYTLFKSPTIFISDLLLLRQTLCSREHPTWCVLTVWTLYLASFRREYNNIKSSWQLVSILLLRSGKFFKVQQSPLLFFQTHVLLCPKHECQVSLIF